MEESGDCNVGFEPIFTRMWNGTHTICKVNTTEELQAKKSSVQTRSQRTQRVQTVSTDGDIRFDIIDDDGSECKGQKLAQTKPINMTKQFSGGEVVCARRGG